MKKMMRVVSIIGMLMVVPVLVACSSKEEEEQVGACFEENALDTFLDQMATMYFAEAEQENLTYKVQNIELKEKGDVNETVQVSLLKGEKEETVTLIFTHDSEGLITKVKPEQ